MSASAETTIAGQNRAKVARLRAQLAEQGIKHLIDGRPVDSASGETFETLTPIDNSPICRVASPPTAPGDGTSTA